MDEQNSEPKREISTLLSVGARGAGKTVFLASCYQQAPDSEFSLQCEDSETEEKLRKIGQYIHKNRQYPPATAQIGNFDFSLRQKDGEREKKLGTLCWWDVPGESCQLYNLAFLTMMLHAEGSLLFLDASNLLTDDRTRHSSLRIFQTMIDIVHHNKKNFLLAVIVTKCDLVAGNIESWNRLQKILGRLRDTLDKSGVEHEFFYSKVSIDADTGTLRSNRPLDSLLWLLSRIDANSPAIPARVGEETEKKPAIAGEERKN